MSISGESTDLLQRAANTPLARRHIAALAGEAPVEDLTAALERAVGEAHLHATTILALAIGVAGGRIPLRLVKEILPDLENMAYVPVIAGIVEGDRINALLDVVAEDRLSHEREAFLLLLATQLLDGGEPPSRLVTRLRTLAREPLRAETELLVGLAARALNDAEVNALAALYIPFAAIAERDGILVDLMAGFFQPVLESLPEEELRLISGYTVVRPEPKVGRNDPCPCGSGRKYKKCCAGREQETFAHPSRVEQFQKLTAHSDRVSDQLFETMRPSELARIDPARLSSLQLIRGMRALALHHRWEAAEQYLDVLSTRTDIPGDPEGFRAELADEALKAGRFDLAEEQMARSHPSEAESAAFSLDLALARKDPDALARLESALAEGHRAHPQTLTHCAFTLLDHYPALGILVARGCISAEHFLDSETLLSEVDRARDRLGLSAREPWWDIFDFLLGDEQGDPWDTAETTNGEGEEREAQIEELRASLNAARSRVERLDQELARRVAQLDSLSAEREELVSMVSSARRGGEHERISELEQERHRLRTKIAELKGEVSEGATQRAELRRELARTADALRSGHSASLPAAVPPDADDDHDDDDDVEGPVTERPRKILVPHFTPAAEDALQAVPSHVASAALRDISLLAARDAPTWGGAKHLRRAHDILSVRIGRSFRLLFRLAGNHLTVLELIHRRDLETTIRRLGR